ncbi:unnamed protein product [Colias eurytheme]|nr:unnamed protein product [Colias eurytheme]
MTYVEFAVNGKKCRVDNRFPRYLSLNAYIRYYLELPGTKAMCHQGVCGSCIVMVHAYRPTFGTYETFSVNSCLVLAVSCHGWEITTIEGVGSRRVGYSEVQKRMAANNATQCGYCTPGWVMQLHSLLDKELTMAELENSFGSNTCRCTGYRPILDTIKSFATDAPKDVLLDIEELKICSKTKKICERKCSTDSINSDWSLIKDPSVIEIDYGHEKYIKVYTVDEIFTAIQQAHDNYMLVDGNTAKGVLPNLFDYPPILIDISEVTSLKQYDFDQNLILGANITLEDCITIFKNEAKSRDDFTYLEQMRKHLDLVAHIPVRRIGSLAGNLMIKHMKPDYQSDIFLLLESVGAIVTIKNPQQELALTLTDFLAHDMSGWLIINFKLPPLSSCHIYKTYKITPRSQNALAIVNAAFNFKINQDTSIIEEATIVFGNISAHFTHAIATENYLTGRNVFSNKVLSEAIRHLDQEITPVENPPEPSPMTRKKLAIGIFYKFILSISPPDLYPSRFSSGGSLITRPLSSGIQQYQTDPTLYPLNQPVQKLEGIIQSSGEAEYVNDIPPSRHDVFGAFVLSTVHSGRVDAYDYDILKEPGVIALLTAKDIPGVNSFAFPGIPLQEVEEEILAENEIKFYGQPIAILVAESENLAVLMADKVKVTYKDVPKSLPVLTIDEAKKDPDRYKAGERDDEKIIPKGSGSDVRKVIKGKYEIGAQYHYYIEPISCVVIPVDKGLEVYSTAQWIDLVQICVARCLSMKESDVFVKVRRLGGGFGGKLSRNVQVATACALVARNLNRPCRFILPYGTNITSMGRRVPAQLTYEVGVNDVGKIQYLKGIIIEDDGCTHNEGILTYVAGSFPNCYDSSFYNLQTGRVLTQRPSNTFNRAPGTLEGIAAIEEVMERIAFELKKDPTEVRLANMRSDDNDIPELIEKLKVQADYDKRRAEVDQFNKDNRWMKKGLHIAVMLFPVEFYGNYSAMVSIYRGDATVTVTTGGIEMGQGVNTKAAQVCAYELGIPLDLVSVLPSYSFVAANNVFSGSSIVSDSVSYAIQQACQIIKDRLAPLKAKMDNPTWLELIQKAGDEQIDLVAEYMMNDKDPKLQEYSAFNVTICEVQLDVLLGRFQINRVDTLEDAGLSANPAVDIGQVEGAYIQGLSYHTFEHFVYDKITGKLLNDRALNYEVYLAKDIPVDYRVYLRFNSKNTRGVLGAKTAGEMGVCTGYGITYALRECINESRKDSGYDLSVYYDFDFPRNTEAILKALDVKLSEFVLKP